MNINCVIIDDEPLAHEILERYISTFQGLKLLKKFTDAYAALDFVYNEAIDLIFLDINMPEIDGITFLKSLKNPPQIIFTTAYRDYAIEGYELNILDFLLKPFAFNRFVMAVNKANIRIEQLKREQNTASPENPAIQDFVFIKSGTRMVKISLSSILYIESMKDYLNICMDGDRIVVKSTMKKMEKMLPENDFIRVHKSYLIPSKRIKSFTKDQIEVDGKLIPIGRNYQELVNRSVRLNSLK